MQAMVAKSPNVSVIMPAFNAGKYIRPAIDSILDQTFRDFELIVINDGSSDDTLTICESLAANDSRIILINQSNRGIAAAINRGVKAARAPLIARMDSDDLALPTRLEHQVNHLLCNPNTALVSSSFIPFTDLSSPAKAIVRLPSNHSTIYATLAFCSPVCHPAVLAKRELFEIFPYRSNIFAEDHDLWCRAIHKFHFENLSEPLLLYRRHEGSTSSQKARQIKFSTLRSGVLHMATNPIKYRQACLLSRNVDRSNYSEINWKWMDRINLALAVR